MSATGWASEHHDGLCPRNEDARFGCLCDLIGEAMDAGRKDALADLRAEVEGLPFTFRRHLGNYGDVVSRDAVLALLAEAPSGHDTEGGPDAN